MTDQGIERSYEIHVLPAEAVSFSRSAGGLLQGVIEGKAYEEIKLYRTHPFTYPSSYLSIRTTKDEELGIIEQLDALDEESRRELEQELNYRYFLPQVTRIDSIKRKTDLWIWELQTNLGPTRITMRNLHEHIQLPEPQRMILTDINGKRCEIQNWTSLDAHSRKQLKDVV